MTLGISDDFGYVECNNLMNDQNYCPLTNQQYYFFEIIILPSYCSQIKQEVIIIDIIFVQLKD
jgi:hypothetical protein